MPQLTHDALVVGGGPAGLSAATWLARHRRRVALVDSGERRNRWVDCTHGYLGLDPVDPGALVERARVALLAYPTAEMLAGRAVGVEARPDGTFHLGTTAGEFSARRLVLATGVEDAFPDVDGFFDHYGADVFHCPTCDGYEARDRRVVVFGWSEHIAGFVLDLLNWAAEVTLITDGSEFEGDASCRLALDRHDVPLLQDDAVALIGARGALEGVCLRSGAVVPCDLAFFSIAHRPRNDLAVYLGCALSAEGSVVVDGEGQTTVPGVYAAGDLVPGLQLVQVAAAQGAVAGVHCALSLRGIPGAADAPAPGPDPRAELLRG